jgi:glutamate N-acetyltransferase / amino-acid N-acetyltransferase
MTGVTAARGFTAGSVAAGIKDGTTLDLALVDAGTPVVAAAVFTTSGAPAAPVIVGRQRARQGMLRAVLLNSGCANAATGSTGLEATKVTTEELAARLHCRADEILPCSTGPIGPQLPVGSIVGALDRLVASRSEEGGEDAALAIMTTDTVPKEAHRVGRGFSIGGMAKGAGMLRPDMATMLAVITTDAVIDQERLEGALSEAVDASFNSLNVDGCMSTNDTVVALASGASGTQPPPGTFEKLLESVCADLALQMARDAEGASRVVTICIAGASDDAAARTVGRVIADSALVRSSFFSGDPNWGRILAALGASGVAFDQEDVEIRYGGVVVASRGVGVGTIEPLSGDFEVTVSIGRGTGSARIVTTDLTPEYVRFNGAPS